MAEKRVKVGKEFEHVPAVKSGRGWLGLEKGKTASVCYYASRKMLCLSVKEGKKVVRRFYKVEDYAKANAAAREANKIGEQAGAGFGALRKEEEAALKRWRAYVLAKEQAGAPARNLDELLREAIEREETKDETPLFADAAFQFLEYKERRGGLSVSYAVQMKSRLNALSKKIGGKRLSEINEAILEKAIAGAATARGGDVIAPKTLKHWLALVREMFTWYFRRENAQRSARERLTNPLEALALPKIEKEKEPEILTTEQARALLLDLREHAPAAVPIVAVQMFCGVRNAEALRLRWRDIVEGEFRLSCAITKTKISRAVPVPENLRAWFDAYAVARGGVPAPEELIFAGADTPARELAEMSRETRKRVEYENEMKRRDAYGRTLRAAFRRAGIEKTQNAFRHTAASCMVKLYGEAAAATYCGHSVRTQGVFYRTAVSAQNAKDYFGIVPPAGDGKAIAFSREGKKVRSRDEAGAGSPPSAENEETAARGEAAAI